MSAVRLLAHTATRYSSQCKAQARIGTWHGRDIEVALHSGAVCPGMPLHYYHPAGLYCITWHGRNVEVALHGGAVCQAEG